MTVFLRTKFHRILEQARFRKVNVGMYLLTKIFEKAWYYLFALLNILLILLNLPVYLIILLVLLAARRTPSANILFIGLEHVIKKTIDRSELFAEKGYTVYYHSLPAKFVDHDIKLQDRIYTTSKFGFITLYGFLASVIKLKPAYVEVYMEPSFTELIPEVIICRILRIPTILIERGMCMNIEIGNSDVFFRKGFQLLLNLVDKVYYREPYLFDHMLRMKIPEKKLVFDYNKVPVSFPEPGDKKGNYTVLFLNSFVPVRRLDLFMEAIPYVLEKFPSAQFMAVGSRSKLEEEYAHSLMTGAGVEGKVKIYPFTKNPRSYFQQASIFIFPADFVFANFSLLEAMEQGLVPIVSDVRDSSRIVEDGVSGFIVERKATEVADRIIRLLQNDDLRVQMGKAAREKIKSEFNHTSRIDSIDEFILRRNWLGSSGVEFKSKVSKREVVSRETDHSIRATNNQ